MRTKRTMSESSMDDGTYTKTKFDNVPDICTILVVGPCSSAESGYGPNTSAKFGAGPDTCAKLGDGPNKSSLGDGQDITEKLGDGTDMSVKLGEGKNMSAKLCNRSTLEDIPGRFRGFNNKILMKLNANKKNLIFLKELLLMIIMMLLLPTWDVGSDVQLAILWFSTRRSWSISMFCVLLVHTFCSAVLWYYLEPREKKKYSCFFVIFQVFPQYRAVSIIYKFIRKSSKDEVVEKDRNTYDMMIGTVEPYVESAPQLVILTISFLSAYGGLSGNLDDTKELEAVTGYTNQGTRKGYFDMNFFFIATLATSFFSASWGVTMFFKNGPIKFLPSKGLISLDFSVALLGTSCFIMWRMTMLATMISSTGYLIPLVYSIPPPAQIMNGNCETIVGVQTDVFLKLRTNNAEYDNSQWNCKYCLRKDQFYARCNETGFPVLGTCASDCDCSPCAPFCSMFGWCQVSARYGRKPKTKTECKELRKNATKCWNPPPLSQDLLQKKCDNMNHWVPYELSSKKTYWDKNTTNVPFYVQTETNYSIVWDEQMHHVLYAPPTALEKCQLERKYCENWQFEQHLFCTDPVTASLWVWFVVFLLPNFLVNILILFITFRYSFFKMVIQHPQLLFQGLLGNFLFGPVDFKNYGEQNKKLQVSGALSVFNFVLTCIQLAIGLFILSRNYYWRFIFVKGEHIDILPPESKRAIGGMEKELIISVVMFLISWKSAFFVFLRITERGQLVPTN